MVLEGVGLRKISSGLGIIHDLGGKGFGFKRVRRGFQAILRRLRPCKIFCYGGLGNNFQCLFARIPKEQLSAREGYQGQFRNPKHIEHYEPELP